MRAPALLLLLLLVLPGGTLRGQRLAPSPFPSADEPAHSPTPSARSHAVGTDPVWLALGGVLGGAAGLFGGAIVGGRLTENDCEDCALVGAVYGGVAGGSAGVPLGVHAANGGRGRLLPSLVASLAIGGAGLGMAGLSGASEIMIGVPVAQLVSAILIERSTSPHPSP